MSLPGVCSPDIWAAMVARACDINEYAAPTRTFTPKEGNQGQHSDSSPGTDFNKRGSWEETGLFDGGWTWARRIDDDRGLVCRPGKPSGVSASIGMVTSRENGWPLFWCWSTSCPEFVSEQPYTRFAVFATIRHAGDYSAAAKDLLNRGYGSPMPEPENSFNVGAGEQPPESDRMFRWMSELQHRVENDKWLWHGFISRGGITLFSALWKAGKSTLLSHLVRAFDGRDENFLGYPITPSRILYVSEEHEELWAERRDSLAIGDHVGMICRPFRGRPSPAEWVAFIAKIAATVEQYRFDAVFMDTISKLWPVREENDAGQVEDALMPLWTITKGGAAMLIAHHNRKSDGKEFTGSRGSGGLPAFMETLMEFRRNTDTQKDPKRILTCAGRYKETPSKLLIELQPSGYVSHGDPDELSPDTKVKMGVGDIDRTAFWQNAAMEIIPSDPEKAIDHDKIQIDLRNFDEKSQGVRERDLREWLDDRRKDGELIRLGTGKRGDPYLWHKL